MATRTQPSARSGGAATDDLFDEAFQKKLEYLALVSRRIFSGRNRAERRSTRSGAGVEFADYRQYTPGDDYRYVDWGAYRRIGKLLLRLNEEEVDLPVYVLIDCSRSMGVLGKGPITKLDFAKKLAAALGYVGLSQLDRVSLVALQNTEVTHMPAARGRHRIFKLFEFLRRLEAEGPTDLATALGKFTAQNKRRGVAIVLSDLFDEAGFEEGLNKLRFARFETHVIQVVDPMDARPWMLGDVELVDAETGERRAVTITPAVARRYAQAYTQYLERVERFCRDKQLTHFALSTTTAPEDAVLELLRHGGVLGK